MRQFYIKHADCYLTQVGNYEWFANKPVYTKDKAKAGKFDDSIYKNIKSKLPADHTLELVVDKKPSFKWVKTLLIVISWISAFIVLVIGCQTIWVLTDAIYPEMFKIALVCCVIFIVTKGVLWIDNRKK